MSRIAVTPLDELTETLQRTGARSLIMLAGPGREAAAPNGVADVTALVFNDILAPRDGLIAPDRSHVRAILDAGRRWDAAQPLVVQCWMGVSRSTAAALLIASQARPDVPPQIWAGRLRMAAPFATPNALMVRLGDEALGLGGRLAAAVNAIGRGAETGRGVPFDLHLDTAAAE